MTCIQRFLQSEYKLCLLNIIHTGEAAVKTKMVRLLSRINPKGELFASTFTYGLTAIIKLGSSLILTRLLSPEVYGVFGIGVVPAPTGGSKLET